MAARPGEENVATLFGDIHYFYSPAEFKPRHHRFDKGSYVYLFENASERRCRVEIANNPGTDDQDAFDGYLDQTRVRYSYKQHCMVSLTVADAVDQNEWHLPTYDPKNENKYHYKLHSLDIYFWTQQDALQFVNGVRRVLPPAQVEVLDEPGPPPQPANMSTVVQKLESAAISDPQYGSPQPPSQPSSQAAGPPPAAGVQAPAQEANFAPMAYNPAAPAAPEAIRPREKTPPPDEDPLNPLAVAVAYDYQKQPFTPGYPPQAQFPPGITSPGLPPGVGSPRGPPPHFAGPPPHPGVQRATSMPAHMGMPSPGLASPYGSGFPGAPGGHPPPPPPQSQPPPQGVHQPQAQQPTPPVTSPGLPPPPPGGYSNYSYSPQSQPAPGPSDYSIHQQMYRPTEAEAANAAGASEPKREPRGRLEENAGRVERGVSGMLKKFEKKFG
ncbi:hypothetical protein ACRE_027480 [Hapsidospora chrysogenum ATCC 11550]|uniref:RNA recognition motif-containing protein n=1 Tax=Hapsidospora chrysogenum (strain ATCC 11550 / CBS 779.69 / DSM 880 / IAM 14645 / JCM 23072 / IMI 49137) TaxID=857340 RepID=A0A086TAQ5_HAPC1|nr:hypothetical protein ACRE_027480 [Hapsidospora chrysogenum ATCC 11550]